jgi:succinate dehydrogenase / fumarate reductase iron-sulfur subunit
MTKRTFQIYRYDPDTDAKPYMQTIEVELDGNERMRRPHHFVPSLMP